MASMRGVMIKCPNCGASVNSPHTSFVIRCDYCGTQVRVQRRTRIFERVLAPENLAPEIAKLPVAIAQHTRRWIAAIVIFVFVIITVTVAVPIILVVKAVGSRTHRTSTTHTTTRNPGQDAPRMEGARPLLVEINGDGVDDVIARVRDTKAQTAYLSAIDGKTGKTLWLSSTIGPRSEAMHTPMAITADTVVISNKNAEVFGFALADGKPRWKIRMHEQLEKLCRGEAGSLVAITKDKQRHRLTLADGSVSKIDDDSDCFELDHDIGHRSSGNVRNISSSSDGAPKRDAIEGMYIDGAIEWKGGEINLAVGYKQPGTAIPHMARYQWPANQRDLPDPDAIRERANAARERGEKKLSRQLYSDYHKARSALEKRTPEFLWKVSVPGIDPMAAKPNSDLDDGAVGIHAKAIAVAYEVKGASAHLFRLTAFSTADGKRLWDVELTGTMPLSGVTVSDTTVFVGRWGSLEAFDVKTGARQFAL